MDKLFTNEQISDLQLSYKQLRETGLSQNKAVEMLANKMYCHPSTIRKYVIEG